MKRHFKNLHKHYEKAGGVLEWFSKQLHQQIVPRREGTNIFDAEWDVCIVLDSCRADLIEDVARDYAFLANCSSTTSGGEFGKLIMPAEEATQ